MMVMSSVVQSVKVTTTLDRRYILENIHDYIGKVATFTYFERTKAGSYRHPLYKTLRNYEYSLETDILI